jgi:SAM-dependent methyltransferase
MATSSRVDDGPVRAYWEDFYRTKTKTEAPQPNELLVREALNLVPGNALDLGCAEGGNAIWLASRGWHVTAVDVSEIALERTTRNADIASVRELVTHERHDLSLTFPDGEFDLVSAQYLQSPFAAPGERVRVLRLAASHVAVGGSLLVVSHAAWPSWTTEPPFPFEFETTDDLIRDLNLRSTDWTVLTAEPVIRPVVDPSGQPGSREDHVVHARRTN